MSRQCEYCGAGATSDAEDCRKCGSPLLADNPDPVNSQIDRNRFLTEIMEHTAPEYMSCNAWFAPLD